MKCNMLRTFLEWALITSLLMSVGFFGWYYASSRKARSLQGQIQNAGYRFQNNHTYIGLLLAQSQEYAKTHPDMQRLLDSLKAPLPAATNKSAGK